MNSGCVKTGRSGGCGQWEVMEGEVEECVKSVRVEECVRNV